MRLFLQINLADWKEQGYEKPLLTFASSLASDVVGTDLDSDSDPYVADLVNKLIDQAQSVFVVIFGYPERPLGASNSLLSRMFNTPEKLSRVILSGENLWAEKMLKPWGEKFIKERDEDKIKQWIKRFAQETSTDLYKDAGTDQ